jgi:uncharacterized protein YjbJ (UPF0337 family)
MNRLIFKGNWNIMKGKLKQKFADLTDEDLTYVEGLEDELFGRIQKKIGQTPEAIQRFIRDSEEADARQSDAAIRNPDVRNSGDRRHA